MNNAQCICCKKTLNTLPYCCQGARILELKSRIIFSTRFIADKSNPIEARIAEKRALKSWRRSLGDLGAA